jgi:hypothetical protein
VINMRIAFSANMIYLEKYNSDALASLARRRRG